MQNKTFRLFISSPFSDFEKEREVLHKKVFPEIEKHCKTKNFTFQPVDLRWGINSEAQLDQKTLEVCLEEVRACKHFPHPNFLIMAGDRYGYVPLPYIVESKEFDDIEKYIVDNNEEITIEYKPEVDLETKKLISQKDPRKTTKLELLRHWYKEDKNQIYDLKNKGSTAYILQIRKDDYEIYVNWEAEENILREILQKAANNIFGNEKDKEYQKYFLSATEQEAIEGIYKFKGKTESQKDKEKEKDKKYIYGYLRTIEKIGDNKKEQAYLDRLDEKPIEKLKEKADDFKKVLLKTLGEKNIKSFSFKSVDDYEKNQLEEFKKYIVEKLKNAINEQLKETKKITKAEQEKAEQEKFLDDKAKGFQGREKTLKAIEDYIKKDNTIQPLVIYGPSGMGKSALMAKAIENTKSITKVFRFVGATQQSTTIRSMLISIIKELEDKKIVKQTDEFKTNSNEFYKQIKEILISIEKPIVIFIDALDQIQNKENLDWMPRELTNNLKIILTVLKDEKYKEDTHYYNTLNRLYNDEFINILDDSLKDHEKNLLKGLLEVENRKLDDKQTKYVLKKWKQANHSPLYLKIAIEEIKHWKADDASETLGDGVEGIISEYLENLEKLYHHEKLVIKKVFGYIHASKDGLSEQELLHILSEDLEDEEKFKKSIINKWHRPITAKNPRREDTEELVMPISVWSRLYTQIKPFIIERNIDEQPLMKFFHREFTTVIDKFIDDGKPKFHEKLASYFNALNFYSEKEYNQYTLRSLAEMPIHYAKIHNKSVVENLFSDLSFTANYIKNKKYNNFILLFKYVVSVISTKNLQDLFDFYVENSEFSKVANEHFIKQKLFDYNVNYKIFQKDKYKDLKLLTFENYFKVACDFNLFFKQENEYITALLDKKGILIVGTNEGYIYKINKKEVYEPQQIIELHSKIICIKTIKMFYLVVSSREVIIYDKIFSIKFKKAFKKITHSNISGEQIAISVKDENTKADSFIILDLKLNILLEKWGFGEILSIEGSKKEVPSFFTSHKKGNIKKACIQKWNIGHENIIKNISNSKKPIVLINDIFSSGLGTAELSSKEEILIADGNWAGLGKGSMLVANLSQVLFDGSSGMFFYGLVNGIVEIFSTSQKKCLLEISNYEVKYLNIVSLKSIKYLVYSTINGTRLFSINKLLKKNVDRDKETYEPLVQIIKGKNVKSTLYQKSPSEKYACKIDIEMNNKVTENFSYDVFNFQYPTLIDDILIFGNIYSEIFFINGHSKKTYEYLLCSKPHKTQRLHYMHSEPNFFDLFFKDKIAFSAICDNEKNIFIGTTDGTLLMYSKNELKLLNKLKTPTCKWNNKNNRGITSLYFDKNRNILFSGFISGSFKIYDSNFNEVFNYETNNWISCICPIKSNDKICFVNKKNIYLLNLNNYNIDVVNKSNSTIELLYEFDNKLYALSCENNSIKYSVFNINTLELIAKYTKILNCYSLFSCKFVKNIFIYATKDGEVIVFDIELNKNIFYNNFKEKYFFSTEVKEKKIYIGDKLGNINIFNMSLNYKDT